MMYLLRIFLLSILILLACKENYIYADSNASSGMRHLTAMDGLAGLTVSDVIDDATGQVWIATSNGVNLYDGSTLLTYHIPHDKSGFPNYCYNLDTDSGGNLYAATKGGLYRLMRHENEFKRIVPSIESVEYVFADGQRIYIGNRSGIFVIDDKEIVRTIPIGDTGVNANNSVRCIRGDGKGNIWFTTRNGITWYDPRTEKSKYYKLQTPSGLCKFDFSGDKIFIGSKNNGLYVMDVRTSEVHHLENLANVINYVECHGNDVLVATNGQGAFVLDAKTEAVTDWFGVDASEDKQLPSNAVYAFHLSRAGEKWFGMYRYGLSHTYHELPLFKSYSLGDFTTEGMVVQAFKINGGKKLIATSQGLYYVDEETGKVAFHDISKFAMSIIKCVEYHNGKYYVGSYDNGLIVFDAATGLISRIEGWRQLAYATVTGLCEHGGKLWISSSEGLFVIDAEDKITNYNEKNSKLPMGVHNIAFDSNNNGWMGTHYGVSLFITKDDFIKNSEFPRGFFNNVPNIILCTGSNDKIYGYNQTKVYYTDPSMEDFGELQIPDGIIDETCLDFFDDGQGRYWIVSEKGLFSTKYDMSGTLHFGNATGLTGKSSGNMSLVKDGKGNLWIATSDGLKYMPMKKLEQTFAQAKFKVLINNAMIDSHLLTNGELLQLNDTRSISLTWNIVAEKLVITPTMPDYTQQDITMIEYSTDGGETWKMTRAGEYIIAENLSLGKHTMQMRLAGCANTLTTFGIYVFPSAMAMAEALLVIIAIVLYILWSRYHKRTAQVISEHKETEQALIEENIAMMEQNIEETEQQKSDDEKYKKSRTADKELARISKVMAEYIKDKKPYMNKDIKMSDIATAIGVSPSVLSQVFSLYLKENYYDYINAFRHEEFKRMIAQGLHKKYTVTALSEQCGFKKTSFFSTFRKIEGMTPTEFIQKKDK